MIDLEFFFDCSSPWTYLGFHNLQPLAAEMGARIRWRPILVGGVFNTVNPSVYASRENPVPAKQAYSLKNMRDWARCDPKKSQENRMWSSSRYVPIVSGQWTHGRYTNRRVLSPRDRVSPSATVLNRSLARSSEREGSVDG